MPTLIPVDNIIGAAEIGVLVSTLIFGITCLQVYRYYTEHCERDGKFLKIWVATVMLLDTFHVALLATFMYYYTVTNYGDYAVLARPTWSLLVEVPVADFLAVMVQLFYVYRIYRLNHNHLIMPLVIALLCLAHFAVSLAYIIKAYQRTAFSFADQVSIEPFNTACLAINIACDSFIAICTTYYLRQKFTGVSSTAKAINKLVVYSLNTCLLTTLIILASLIAWRVQGETLIGSAFYFVAMRLYSCSLMSILNSRDGLREDLGQKGTNFISLGRIVPALDRSSDETRGESLAGNVAKRTEDGVQKVVLITQHSQASIASD